MVSNIMFYGILTYRGVIIMNKKQQFVWDKISDTSWQYQKSMDKLTRKQIGAYYTNLKLTDIMISELFKNLELTKKQDIYSKTFFEPCVGVGNFVFSYLKYIYENFKPNKHEAKMLLSNIYVCDSDDIVVGKFLKLLSEFVEAFFNLKLDEKFKLKNVGRALIFDVEHNDVELLEPKEYFKIKNFDIIITNPPYKVFKTETKHYENQNSYKKDKDYYDQLKQIIKEKFNLQGRGIPNFFKLFVEKIITEYVKPTGLAYLLIPQSILKDQSSTMLREYILQQMEIKHIYNIDEHTNYVDAKQSLTALLVKNISKNSLFHLVDHFGTSAEVEISIDSSKIKNNFNSSIISLSENEMKILDRMNSFPKIKEIPYIKNYRGELDLTINKKSIVMRGKYPLIRGRNLSIFKLKNGEVREYVDDEFVANSNKKRFIASNRIACPQISNINARKRLLFSYIPANIVLGNSCNFISVSKNDQNIDLYYLLALLNSNLFDWYFRVFSSNNHINNYEIDNLPFPILPVKKRKELSNLAYLASIGENELALAKIDNILSEALLSDKEEKVINKKCIKDIQNCFPSIKISDIEDYLQNKKSKVELEVIYDLSNFDMTVIDSINKKYEKIDKGEVLNHTSFKLSELDMEMVKSVKPGGNWKQIPLKVAKKSKRLMKIRETGGRTTLYGRLDYENPSYTITTYFNRPGNGTNIHPAHDRVLSVREAARIQSFPDDYFFYGNKKNKLNQIGNAVPPLMAYQIAKSIKRNLDIGISLDLFNGAGGMTVGFKEAGFHSVLMNDIDEAALITAKVNSPSSPIFLGDLTKEENKRYIIEYAKKNNVDIINGGPPCQGFSMAGFRNPDDPRSKLIFDYVEVLKQVHPKVFVFENVQGLLSHNNGRTFKELLKMFDTVGYKVEARLLDFSDYGIPQKRKRVIIIGTQKSIAISPEQLFPKPLTIEKNKKTTVKDAIGDLQSVPLDEKSYYQDSNESDYVKVLKRKKKIDLYLKNLNIKSTSLNDEVDKILQIELF